MASDFDTEGVSDEEKLQIYHLQYYSKQCVDWLNSIISPPTEIKDDLLDIILEEAAVHGRCSIDVRLKDVTVINVTSC